MGRLLTSRFLCFLCLFSIRTVAGVSVIVNVLHDETIAVDEIHRQQFVEFNSDDLQSELESLQSLFTKNESTKAKRSLDYVMSNLADSGWDTTWDERPVDVWDDTESLHVVTEEEKTRAEREQFLKILKYVGITLGSVAVFSVMAFFLFKDPKSFIVAFGCGCPCLLPCCPCIIRMFEKYTNPDKLMQENINIYVPGILITPEGKIERYNPSPEELDRLADVMEEIQSCF